jgi:hypothetical protein
MPPKKSQPESVKKPMTSQQLTQKAAGYLLAAGNAARRETKK